jgi:hypothetical protein
MAAASACRQRRAHVGYGELVCAVASSACGCRRRARGRGGRRWRARVGDERQWKTTGERVSWWTATLRSGTAAYGGSGCRGWSFFLSLAGVDDDMRFLFADVRLAF